jgi:hypothetical protein
LVEETVKLPAGGIKGSLLLLGTDTIDQQAALVIDSIVENLLDIFPS